MNSLVGIQELNSRSRIPLSQQEQVFNVQAPLSQLVMGTDRRLLQHVLDRIAVDQRLFRWESIHQRYHLPEEVGSSSRQLRNVGEHMSEKNIPTRPASTLWKWSLVLFSLAVLACFGQIVCVLSAIVGGRENRIHLMGAFVISPFALALCVATFASLMVSQDQNRSKSLLTNLSFAMIIGQLALFLLG